MSGPEHYREAEAKLDAAGRIARPDSGHTDADATLLIQVALQRAQVHATLALAEAVVAGAVMRPEDRDDWDRATGRLEVTP